MSDRTPTFRLWVGLLAHANHDGPESAVARRRLKVLRNRFPEHAEAWRGGLTPLATPALIGTCQGASIILHRIHEDDPHVHILVRDQTDLEAIGEALLLADRLGKHLSHAVVDVTQAIAMAMLPPMPDQPAPIAGIEEILLDIDPLGPPTHVDTDQWINALEVLTKDLIDREMERLGPAAHERVLTHVPRPSVARTKSSDNSSNPQDTSSNRPNQESP